MKLRPRLKAMYRSQAVGPELLVLMGEHRNHVLEAPVYVQLVPLLDGTRTFPELISATGGKVPLQSLMAALTILDRRGCLAEGEAPDGEAEVAFWDYHDVAPEAARETLDTRSVHLTGVGDVDMPSLEGALTGSGVRVDATGDVTVVATDDYLHDDLQALADRFRDEGRSWMLVKPTGLHLWVGPYFPAAKGPCFDCLAERLRRNRQTEDFIRSHSDEDLTFTTSRASIPATRQVGASFGALELVRVLVSGAHERLQGEVRTLDLTAGKLATHAFQSRAACALCGDGLDEADPEAAARVELESRPRSRHAGGPDRAVSAEETFARYEHHISPITGTVTYLVPLERDPYGPTYSYAANHYFPVRERDRNMMRPGALTRSGGKGITEAQAKVSALCESLERASGIARGDEPQRIATFQELGDDAVHIRDVALFSAEQYRTRDEWNPKAMGPRHQVPPELADDARIAWSPLWSLTDERVRWVPKAYCWYGHFDDDHFFTRSDSNGCAAGNSLEEAVLYGFLELVERDAVALWWYNRLRRPLLDPSGLGLPYWSRMERYYADMGRSLHLLDLTADMGIPTVAAISRRLDAPSEDVIVASGAHLEMGSAVVRALVEANQYLPGLRRQDAKGNTIYGPMDEETLHWWKTASFEAEPWLAPADGPAVDATAVPGLSTGDVLTDIEECVDRARARGLEVLVLDQTRADIGLPVARVVVPGLRHFWRRLGAGRLYDVPVELGWLDEPTPESELNPTSCHV